MKSYKNIISFILITLFLLCSFNAFAQELTFTTVTEAVNYTGADKETATKITITGQISGTDYSANSEWSKFRTLNETFPSLEEIEILTDQDIPYGKPSDNDDNITMNNLFCLVFKNGDYEYSDWLKTFSAPNITTIGEAVFYGCESLITIDFPKVTTIKIFAFYGCKSLTTADFPLATTIGYSAFFSCESLTTIDFPLATTIENSAFSSCKSLITADFPNVTNIGMGSFRECESLTTASFPKVTTIIENAFYGCESLTTANFPLATTIGEYAFNSCESLTTIDFPKVTNIGKSTFYVCENLTAASFPNATDIGDFAFFYCESLTTIDLPNVITLGEHAFYGGESSLTAASFGTEFTIPTTIILNEKAFNSNNTPDIDLTLGENVLPAPDLTNMTWNGYTWKSINIQTSITENPLISSIQISPNPVSSASNIEIYSIENQANTTINIVDFSGQEIANIYSGTLNEGKTNFPISINLTNGSYFLLIKNDNGQKIKSFVVAK